MLSKAKRIAGHFLCVKFNYINGAKETYSVPPLFSCPYLLLSSRNSLLHSLAFFFPFSEELKVFNLDFWCEQTTLLFCFVIVKKPQTTSWVNSQKQCYYTDLCFQLTAELIHTHSILTVRMIHNSDEWAERTQHNLTVDITAPDFLQFSAFFSHLSNHS